MPGKIFKGTPVLCALESHQLHHPRWHHLHHNHLNALHNLAMATVHIGFPAACLHMNADKFTMMSKPHGQTYSGREAINGPD